MDLTDTLSSSAASSPSDIVIDQLLNPSNVESLAHFAAMSASNAEKVCLNLQHRMDSLAAPFFSSGMILREILQTCDTVVSGSAALCLLLPISTTKWKPNDLDLYVPHRHMKVLTGCLQSLGYQLLPCGPDNHCAYSSSQVTAVHKFILGQNVIEVIESSTDASFSPIFLFDSTAVMNFVSANTIFAAYPNLTLQYKSLLNPYSLYGNTYDRIKISHLEKYLQRGFQFIPCQESHTSPFQCRSNACAVTDSGSLWINLRTGLRMEFLQYGVLDVEWRLGGHICGSDCFLRPRIHVIKDKSWVSLSFPPPFEIVLSYLSVRSYLYSHWSVQ